MRILVTIELEVEEAPGMTKESVCAAIANEVEAEYSDYVFMSMDDEPVRVEGIEVNVHAK